MSLAEKIMDICDEDCICMETGRNVADYITANYIKREEVERDYYRHTSYCKECDMRFTGIHLCVDKHKQRGSVDAPPASGDASLTPPSICEHPFGCLCAKCGEVKKSPKPKLPEKRTDMDWTPQTYTEFVLQGLNASIDEILDYLKEVIKSEEVSS